MKSILFETQSGKPCATCSKCCEGWLTGNAYGFEFKPGTPCKFITNTGCGIYAARPEDPCKTFKCHWKTNPRIPDWLRPDLSQVIILPRYLEEKRYLRLFNSGSIWPESKVFEWAEEFSKTGQNLVGYDRTGARIFSQDSEFLELAKKEFGL